MVIRELYSRAGGVLQSEVGGWLPFFCRIQNGRLISSRSGDGQCQKQGRSRHQMFHIMNLTFKRTQSCRANVASLRLQPSAPPVPRRQMVEAAVANLAAIESYCVSPRQSTKLLAMTQAQ